MIALHENQDLFSSGAEALVNPVNCFGVMGKGLAKQFAIKFPVMKKAFYKACKKDNAVNVGESWIWENTENGICKWVFCFPTKVHWNNLARLEYVESGLDHLIRKIVELDIKSIALPALGCGEGCLLWSEVKPLMIGKLSEAPENCVVHIYSPIGGEA